MVYIIRNNNMARNKRKTLMEKATFDKKKKKIIGLPKIPKVKSLQEWYNLIIYGK